jgi:hypothetical protein
MALEEDSEHDNCGLNSPTFVTLQQRTERSIDSSDRITREDPAI